MIEGVEQIFLISPPATSSAPDESLFSNQPHEWRAMGIVRKHISKSGKRVLVFRRQPVIGSSGVIPREAQSDVSARPIGGPAVRIDAFPGWLSSLSK
jgi:hypothetical protein